MELCYYLLTLTFLRLPVGNLPSHYLPLRFIYFQSARYICYLLSAASSQAKIYFNLYLDVFALN